MILRKIYIAKHRMYQNFHLISLKTEFSGQLISALRNNEYIGDQCDVLNVRVVSGNFLSRRVS